MTIPSNKQSPDIDGAVFYSVYLITVTLFIKGRSENKMPICHRCKEQMFEWEGKRSELLPNSRFHVYYHTGCFQQIKMERGELSLHARRKTDVKPEEKGGDK